MYPIDVLYFMRCYASWPVGVQLEWVYLRWSYRLLFVILCASTNIFILKYFYNNVSSQGEQCKFEHELVVPDKKKELCKFYLQGYCSKGDNCIYMHNIL